MTDTNNAGRPAAVEALRDALKALRRSHDVSGHGLTVAQLLIIDDALAQPSEAPACPKGCGPMGSHFSGWRCNACGATSPAGRPAAVEALPTAMEYAAKRQFAVTSEWCRGWDDARAALAQLPEAPAATEAMGADRAALTELVACKDLKEKLAAYPGSIADQETLDERTAVEAEYGRRQPLAWVAARAALSGPAAPAEPVALTYCINCDSPMPEGCRGTLKGDGQCALENPAKVTSEPPMSPEGEGPLYDDPYFGVQDEVYLTRAVSVMNDVLTDISGWEDQALAEAIKSSKVDLSAMIECIRMRADSSYVPGSKPIDGEVAAPVSAAEQKPAPIPEDQLQEIFEASTHVIWPREGDFAGLSGNQLRHFAAALSVSADAQKAQSEHSQRGPEDADFPWPKLLKPAHVCGTMFGVGVSSRLVVECAMRHADYKAQEAPKTTEQRQQDEANRRSLWDMIHGPVDPANPLGEILADQAKRTVYKGGTRDTVSPSAAQKAVAREPLTDAELCAALRSAPWDWAFGNLAFETVRWNIDAIQNACADKWGIRLSGSTEGESNHG